MSEITVEIKKSETFLHIVSLLSSENLDKFHTSNPGGTIPFPFDLQTFCQENDLKLELQATFKKPEDFKICPECFICYKDEQNER